MGEKEKEQEKEIAPVVQEAPAQPPAPKLSLDEMRKLKEEERRKHEEALEKRRAERRAKEKAKLKELEDAKMEERRKKQKEEDEKKKVLEEEAAKKPPEIDPKVKAAQEQQATLTVLKVLQKLSNATPTNFEELLAELNSTLEKELPNAGRQQKVLKEEADRVVQYSKHYVQQVREKQRLEKEEAEKGGGADTKAEEKDG